MKKIFFAAGLALSCAANISIAQENAGGSDASGSAFGAITNTTIVAGAVGIAIAAAVISNNRGTAAIPPGPGPGPGPDPEPACSGEDPLVDGVCIGTSSTVIVSGTTTVEVPVTFTYLPTI
jgi:hypothetical protein